MKRFLVILTLALLLALSFAAHSSAAEATDDEANVPTWAQAIRDNACAMNMGVYVHNVLSINHRPEDAKWLERALGDYSRQSSYVFGKIIWHVMAWDSGGATTLREMEELKRTYHEAVSRYYRTIWPL